MSAGTATVAEEEYLQSLFWLQEAGLPMTGANVARAMQLSAPTVHEMIGRLERDGYITRGTDRAIAFTESGAEHAEGIVRRHRLIERFLTDVLGVPWDEVHEEAERLEHAMSPVLEERMLAAIGDAKTCPHGHPIVAGARLQGVPLADVEVGASLRVLRFENEAEDLLHYLKASGIEPGLEGTLVERDEAKVVRQDGRRRDCARHPHRSRETVSVIADPSPPPRTDAPRAACAGPALRALRAAERREAADQPPISGGWTDPVRSGTDCLLLLPAGGACLAQPAWISLAEDFARDRAPSFPDLSDARERSSLPRSTTRAGTERPEFPLHVRQRAMPTASSPNRPRRSNRRSSS